VVAAESIPQSFSLAEFCSAGVPMAVIPIIMNRKNTRETPALPHSVQIGAGMMAPAPIRIFLCVVSPLEAGGLEERVW
jgi:hypothetical protein